MASPAGRFELNWGGKFKVGGAVVDASYPRYDAPGVQAPRNPSQLTINGTAHKLRLDWTSGLREETAIRG